MDPLQELETVLRQVVERPAIQKAHRRTQKESLIKWILETGRIPYTHGFPEYRFQEITLLEFVANLENYKIENPQKSEVALAFGDSIIAFAGKQLTSVDPRLNFGQPGSGSPNFTRTAESLYPYLKNLDVNYIVLGCFGGNPLLSYQDYNSVKQETETAFRSFRTLFPNARLIVYGPPPVYDPYVNLFIEDYEKYLYSLVLGDKNSVYLHLRSKFSNHSGVFPDKKYSSDGVHLTKDGIQILDRMIQRAKTTSLKLILDEK